MEEAGIEPATCRMQSDHSTPELHPRGKVVLVIPHQLHIIKVHADRIISYAND